MTTIIRCGNKMAESLEKLEGSSIPKEPHSSSSNIRFDFQNWYYWSIWWQQFFYWQSYLSQQHTQPFNQWNNYYTQWNNVVPTQSPVGGQGRIDDRIRHINGFETYISSPWRRLLAELIDILIVTLVMKWFYPQLDFRVPEAIFLGADVVLSLSDDELEDIGWTMIVFFISVLIERISHVIMETICTYRFGCTFGKWLMGLRIYQCTVVNYTRTEPGRTIKIQPGIKMGFSQALVRALFKCVVNMFCPLIIFFIVLDKGRTQYDRVFKCAVVNSNYLYRPVYLSRTQNNQQQHQ